MNLSDVLQKAFRAQVTAERQNEAFYWQAALNLEAQAWDGFAEWMKKASGEEKEHAEKFAAFLIERNADVNLDALSPVDASRLSVLGHFTAALEAERENTARLNRLYALCVAENDYDAALWLQWALREQAVSEKELTDHITRLHRVDNNAALLELDEHINDA